MKRVLPIFLACIVVFGLIVGFSLMAVSCSNAQQNAPVEQTDEDYDDSQYYEDESYEEDDDVDIDIHKPKKTNTYKHDSYKSRSYSGSGSKRK